MLAAPVRVSEERGVMRPDLGLLFRNVGFAVPLLSSCQLALLVPQLVWAVEVKETMKKVTDSPGQRPWNLCGKMKFFHSEVNSWEPEKWQEWDQDRWPWWQPRAPKEAETQKHHQGQEHGLDDVSFVGPGTLTHVKTSEIYSISPMNGRLQRPHRFL